MTERLLTYSIKLKIILRNDLQVDLLPKFFLGHRIYDREPRSSFTRGAAIGGRLEHLLVPRTINHRLWSGLSHFTLV